MSSSTGRMLLKRLDDMGSLAVQSVMNRPASSSWHTPKKLRSAQKASRLPKRYFVLKPHLSRGGISWGSGLSDHGICLFEITVASDKIFDMKSIFMEKSQ
jgi:hypothetical protein